MKANVKCEEVNNEKHTDSLSKNTDEILFNDERTGISAGINKDGMLFLGNSNNRYTLPDTPVNRECIKHGFERYTTCRYFNFENGVGTFPDGEPITFNTWDEKYEL